MKRATEVTLFPAIRTIYFNPRPREEGDLALCVYRLPTRYFNPRPREEGDPSVMSCVEVVPVFQSTPS